MTGQEVAAVVRRAPYGDNPSVGQRGTGTQQRILEAALEVFSEVGFHDASVELLARGAGCSRPAFYQYFASKQDVFWHLAGRLDQMMGELGNTLGTVTADEQGVAHLTAWLGEFADLYDRHAPIFATFQAAVRDQDRLASASGAIRDRAGGQLLRSFGPSSSGSESASVAAGVFTMVVRYNFYRRSLAGVVSRRRSIRGLAELVHRVFAGPLPGVNLQPSRPLPRATGRGARPVAHEADPVRASRPQAESLHQRLLQAGSTVLATRGYHATRIDDITVEAGVSHGCFYRYFKNKAEFFRVLAELATSQMAQLIDVFPDAAVDDGDELRAWLVLWFAGYRRNGGVISTWQEMQPSDPGLNAFSQEMAASVLERLTAILAQRRFGDALADAVALLALFERLPYSVVTLGYAEELDAIEAMTVIIRRGFMGVDGQTD